MAVIKSGASVDELTIDPTSKAARITLYDSLGNEIVRQHKDYLGSYMARIEIIPSTLVTGTTYWAMRNLGANRVFIRKLILKLGFSGTVAATRSQYEFERFTAATPTGGTAVAAVLKDTTHPATSVTDIRLAAAGLVTAGLVFGNIFHQVGSTDQLNDDITHIMEFGGADDEIGRLVLNLNEGLCIRANSAIVAGSHILGSIHWDERV